MNETGMTNSIDAARKPPRRKPATMADVARIAGVGVSTVSYILRNKDTGWSISDDAKKRVREAARQVAYEPNAAARALVTRKTYNVGFLLADTIGDGFANPYFSAQLVGVEQVTRQHGYGLRINRYTRAELDRLVVSTELGHRTVDGMILTGFVESATARRLSELDLPCVSVGDTFETNNLMASVTHTHADGLYEAVCHMASFGHRRIGWCEMGGNVGNQRTRQILQQKIAQNPQLIGVQLSCVPSGYVDFAEGHAFFKEWAQQPVHERLTGIMMSEPMAQAFLKNLYHAGLSCPRDVSLIVTSESRASEYMHPPMTALNHHCEKLGQIAAELLIGYLTKGDPLNDTVSPLPTSLSVRESCAVPAVGS